MPRIKDIRTPGMGGMNLDVDVKLIDPKQSRETRNLRSYVTEDGRMGTKQKIKSNLPVDYHLLTDYAFKVVGSCPDHENNAIIYFVCDLDASRNDHMILRFYPNQNTIELIFRQSMLNFKPYILVSANVIGGLLYWSFMYDTGSFDHLSYNPPRKINISKAYNLANGIPGTPLTRYFPVSGQLTTERVFNLMDAVKHPPRFAPTLYSGKYLVDGVYLDFERGMGSDPAYKHNLIKEKNFQFRYRFKYDDGEKSRWSPISRLTYAVGDELPDGSSIEEMYINNVINIVIETGALEVQGIEVAVREGNYGSWMICERIHKYNEDGVELIQSYSTMNYLFYNNTVKLSLDQNDTNELFDYVPQVVSFQEIIENNRLLYANITEGFDAIDTDIQLESLYEFVQYNDVEDDLEIVHGWRYQRKGGYDHDTRITSQINFSSPDFIPGNVYFIRFIGEHFMYYPRDPGSGIIVEVLGQKWFGAYCVIRDGMTPDECARIIVDQLVAQMEPENTSVVMIAIHPDEYFGDIIIPPQFQYGMSVPITGNVDIDPHLDTTKYEWLALKDTIQASIIKPTRCYPTFKSGSWVDIGIIYNDRVNRSSPTFPGNRVYLPSFNEKAEQTYPPFLFPIHRIKIKWWINHIPPEFATHYRFVIGQSSLSYFLDFAVPGTAFGKQPTTNLVYISVNDEIFKSKEALTRFGVDYYTWQKGDRIRFVSYSLYNLASVWKYYQKVHDKEIVGIDYFDAPEDEFGYETDGTMGDDRFKKDDQDNKVRNPAKLKILLQNFDLDELFITDSNLNFYMVEIYRPANEVADDERKTYFEFGEEYEIGDPHTENRYHKGKITDQVPGVKAAYGIFDEGNAYIRIRTSSVGAYAVEDQSISDFYSSKFTNIGRINAVDKDMKRRNLSTTIRYGGLFVQNVNVNDLTHFSGGDMDSLKNKFGPIIKIREKGYVLKVMQRYKISSVYLGRAGLRLAESLGLNENELLASSDKILGTRYESKEIYGIENAKNECVSPNYDYFVDINNGVIIREAPNGMVPISRKYGVDSFVKQICKNLKENAYIINIICGYHEDFDEIYFTFYGTRPQMADILETIVFHEASNMWYMYVDMKNSSGIPPEHYSNIGNIFVAFCQGHLWVQDAGQGYCNLFGKQYTASIKLVFNQHPRLDKIFKEMIIDGTGQWQAPETGDIVVESESGVPMISRLKYARFKKKHGVFYAPLGKNMTTNSLTANSGDLISGTDLRGNYLVINLKEENSTDAVLRSVEIESIISQLSG